MTEFITGWGYEGHTIDDLIQECRRTRAKFVVDIRLNAISRKRGFSKKALSESLSKAGIEYIHLRALGNPKSNRPGFAHPGTPEAEVAHRRFNEEVLGTDEAASQLAQLEELEKIGNVIILCFEETPRCCHRHLVIQRLREREKSRSLF